MARMIGLLRGISMCSSNLVRVSRPKQLNSIVSFLGDPKEIEPPEDAGSLRTG